MAIVLSCVALVAMVGGLAFAKIAAAGVICCNSTVNLPVAT